MPSAVRPDAALPDAALHPTPPTAATRPSLRRALSFPGALTLPAGRGPRPPVRATIAHTATAFSAH